VANNRTDDRGGQAGRQTKAQRKEHARVERERIQQQMRRRARNRNIGIALIAMAVVTVVVVVFVIKPGGSSAADVSTKGLLARAAADAKAAGCGSIQEIGYYGGVSDPSSPDYKDQSHIGVDSRFPQMPPISSYPSVPATSGPHNPVPMPAGVYSSSPELDRVIHSQEHAGVTIWYSPNAPQAAIDEITSFYGQQANVGQAKVIVAPYDYSQYGAQGKLPAGAQMVLVAWHRMQTCAAPSLSVAYSFSSQYNNVTPGGTYKGVAPEANASM
jgi:hypothetical protein